MTYRVPMSFRVSPEFKARVDQAARENGRSLAQEIELRLERTMETQGPRRPRGRPRNPGNRKRAQFNTRLRQALRAALADEAALAGRSLSEEIEYRLERSLVDQPAFGSRKIVHVALIPESTRSTEAVFAVCADGSCWWLAMPRTPGREWTRLPAIPEDEDKR